MGLGSLLTYSRMARFCRNPAMDSAFRPFSAGSDELLLNGRLLSALEFGQLRMDAQDYLDIAARASMLLDECQTAVLLRLRREGPRALRDIAENALYERGMFDWTTHDPDRSHARLVWEALLHDLTGSSG